VSRTQNAVKPVKTAQAKDVMIYGKDPYRRVQGVNSTFSCSVKRK